ncbi:MAG TPA: transglycosylase SLT domain-containing protein, partial [Cyclobacteriaceae bacterium]|nr:transglycosylase SLT domain-containing protein [Cyclobacteriaceae bacterium]
DAVSVSNAVGFWQFKDFTAIEMGLRVDNVIDERMNIASSSRAAAGYLKKNNYYFNNWIYAVQAYQMGAGGALKVVDEKYFGAKQMDVDAKTYWYVKKFLAHVVAFQDAVKGTAQVQVAAVPINEEKNISRLAKELSIDEAELREFNKWVRTDKIPADRTYTLVLPSGKFDFEKAGALAAASASTSKAEPKPADVKASERRENTSTRGSIVMHNDLPVIRASAGENVSSLASRSGIGLKKFLKYNDLSISSNIKEGELYYLKPKRRYGYSTEAYHVVQPNDKLWQISQDYAIKLNRLKTLNNVYQDNALKQGMHLWLSGGKQGQNLARAEIALVDAESTFNWSLSPQQEAQQATQSVVKDEVDKTAPDLKVEQPAYGH